MSSTETTDRLDAVLANPSRLLAVGGLLVLVVVPFVLSGSQVSTWTTYLTFAILALAIDLVWGYTGLLTLGHAAFFGAGAYLSAKLLTEVPAVPDLVVVFALAPAFTALLTLAIGWFLFSANVSDSYFAISTLIVSIVFARVAGEFVGFLGGFNGIYGIPSIEIAGFEPNAPTTYLFVLGVLVALFLLSRAIVTSAFGRQLRGIREDRERTEMFGYNTEVARLLVFVVSGAMAGLAGGLYATVDGFVSPPLLGFVLSTEAVIWVAVGGRGTLVGAVLGALLIQYLNSSLSEALLNFWQIALALVFIAVVLGAPRGLVGRLEDATDRLRARRSPDGGPADSEAEPTGVNDD
jgi:ABC-type branched-subunit amino acid transport system permease subunit